jgi:hypothetical protein
MLLYYLRSRPQIQKDLLSRWQEHLVEPIFAALKPVWSRRQPKMDRLIGEVDTVSGTSRTSERLPWVA